MATIERPEEVFAPLVEDYKALYRDGLVSIILYGSGAGKDYRPGKSDVNFLVVLTDDVIDGLDRALDTVARWRKKNVAVPLFMTRSYIHSSCDAFPLEFLTMKNSYRVVHGDDVLSEISFDMNDVRLQCEREIKGKLLLLREGFMGTGGKRKQIEELIAASITAFVAIFHGLLYLKGREIPATKREIIHECGEVIPINRDVFTACLDIKEGKKDRSSDVTGLFTRYLAEVRKLWQYVDTMEV
jgi:predicted nucleotidyltransferase